MIVAEEKVADAAWSGNAARLAPGLDLGQQGLGWAKLQTY
jgi:hypothetical protein